MQDPTVEGLASQLLALLADEQGNVPVLVMLNPERMEVLHHEDKKIGAIIFEKAVESAKREYDNRTKRIPLV